MRFVAIRGISGVVQDYFCQPSWNELSMYMTMSKEITKREEKLQRTLNSQELSEYRNKFLKDDASKVRCEEFFNMQYNKNIGLEDITEMDREFYTDIKNTDIYIKKPNIIVLGRKDQQTCKIGLSVIDY